MSRTKTFEYTVQFRVEALNFDKAHARCQTLDEWADKHGFRRVGETRLREREKLDEAQD